MNGSLADIVALEKRLDEFHPHGLPQDALPRLPIPASAAITERGRELFEVSPHHCAVTVGPPSLGLGRRLFIAFAIRNDKIRVISAREMSKKEREQYE